MSKESKKPQEILRLIKDGAGNVRTAGEELTSRIRAFEAWLGKLPGRVEAECELWSDDYGQFASYLSFERDGKGGASNHL